MYDIGVIHGRFQVLHNDHLAYLLAGKELCDHLVVGITNPDPSLTREEAEDAQRSTPGNNPLTYFERYTMVRAVLHDAGLGCEQFSVVPLPINMPELYGHYVPLDAAFFLTIYDEWGRRKKRRFEELGLTTHVLWEREPHLKGISAKDVRARICNREPIDDLTPPATVRLVREWNLGERLQALR
ncbi:adenylyltransferase/cytidyltransferase family protein [Salidesulfovibrio onnuriiensis]|uniref:adenylyltransferase/cytidyltransferase family protein n=1 Tax=Salidesulfovibrio onnuriiensis TaxID=2583823 RepID=UPI0011CC6833|nr:adenylyltransferase/cytidyltransferase family protein [Salidesulfovibrio onnuriiensis]